MRPRDAFPGAMYPAKTASKATAALRPPSMIDQPYSQVDMLLKSPKVFLQPSDCISVLESLQITCHDEYQF